MKRQANSAQELEQIQKVQEKEYNDCSTLMEKEINRQKESLDYGSIQKIAENILSTRVNNEVNDHMREVIKKNLINQYVVHEINKKKEYWFKLANNAILNVDFRLDLEGQINQIKTDGCQTPSIERIVSELRNLCKNPAFNKNFDQNNQYGYTNSFMCALSEVFQQQIREMFENNKYHTKYLFLQDAFILHIDMVIFNTFKDRYKQLHKEQQDLLGQQQEPIKIYTSEIISKQLSKMKKEEFCSKKEDGKCLNQFITELLRDALKQKYQVEQAPFYLIIDEHVKKCEQDAYIKYEQLFMEKKDQMLEEQKKEFAKIMKFIYEEKMFSLPFSQSDIEKDIFYVIMNCIKVRNQKERDLFEALIFYMSDLKLLDCSKQDLINQYQSSTLEEIQEVKNIKQFQVEEKANSFLSYLKQLQDNSNSNNNNHSSSNDFYVLLCQIYMLVTNIKVVQKNDQILIEILPYYGYFYDLKSRIAEYLYNGLESSIAPLFFNYLDLYFEGNEDLLNNQNVRHNFENQQNQNNQQSPKLIDLLRRNFDYPQDYFEKLKSAFYQKFSLIKHDLKMSIPEDFYLVRISPPEIKSRNVIIAISGFTSEKEDKQIKWRNLGKLYPNCEIFALQYKSASQQELDKEIIDYIYAAVLPIAKCVKLLFTAFKFNKENAFDKATQEANSCGKFLAHLIHKGYFLPNSSFSLVGFSLGTQVIQEFLIEYKDLLEKSNAPNSYSAIASIVLMGGVACADIIKEKKIIDVVSHKFYNCYSKNDGVLSYIYRIKNLFSKKKPVGLNKIKYDKYDDMNKVVNREFTSTISGHEEFMLKHNEVLQQIDYRQEFFNNCTIDYIFSKQLLQKS